MQRQTHIHAKTNTLMVSQVALTSFMIELDPLLLVVGSSNASRRQDQTRFQMKIEDVDRR